MLKNKSILRCILVFVALAAATMSGLWIYYMTLEDDLEQQAHATLDEILEQQRFNFKSEMNAAIELVSTNGILISQLDSDGEDALAGLKEIAKQTRFEFLIVADMEGNSINSDGVKMDVAGYDHYERAIKGETFIPEPTDSMISTEMVIPISAPIRQNGEIVGALMGAYSVEHFNQLLLPSYSGMGYAFIVDSSGEVIAKTENDNMLLTSNNLFESWRSGEADFYKFGDLNAVLDDVENKRSGHASYRMQDENRLIHYSPVGVNDWYIFVAVPEDIVSNSAANIVNHAGWLAVGIIVCFSAFVSYIFILQTRSVKQKAESIRQLERMAYVDELTGRQNYNKFKIDAQRILKENEQLSHILVKIDVENFKLINKIYGFKVGDQVLKAIGDSIDSLLAEDLESFARLGVDEFVILNHYQGQEHQIQLQQKFEDRFYELMGKDFNYKVTFKVGQYVINREETQKADINEIFEMANFAHRQAKQSAATNATFYNESMSKEALKQKEIENHMESALEKKEFQVYMQPKYRLEGEMIDGAEALARWQPIDGDMIYPNEFIPVFEKNGFIIKLDMYMLNQVCEVVEGWIESGITPITVSVNFSRLHLGNPNFVKEICEVVDRHHVPRQFIEVEVTETAIFENLKAFETVLTSLHQSGFTLSMDDFGSGYSSLGLLKNLQVDVLKIDRSFFVNQQNEDRTKTVVASIIRMADELLMSTVAEGVEDKKHIDLLQELGCGMVQGYYYAKPMPNEEFTRKLMDAQKNK